MTSKTLAHLGNALIRVGTRLGGRNTAWQPVWASAFVVPGKIHLNGVNNLLTGTYTTALPGRRIRLDGDA